MRILFLYFLLGLSSCTFTVKKAQLYELGNAVERYVLPGSLNEISGLHAFSDSVLLVVQDEKAILYFLSLKGKIIGKESFGKDGDFEGVTAHNKSFYGLKSSGKIIRLRAGKRKVFEFKKKGDFEFEGICSDPQNNRLLVACKTHPQKDKKHFIYIYAFNIKKNKYEKDPAFKINKNDLSASFHTSACAIHPNGNLYLLSSTAQMLISIDPKGEIIERYYLSGKRFNQPEGITFLSNGDLFISNEKRNTVPTLLHFSSSATQF